jgi:hypothetical protein
MLVYLCAPEPRKGLAAMGPACNWPEKWQYPWSSAIPFDLEQKSELETRWL